MHEEGSLGCGVLGFLLDRTLFIGTIQLQFEQKSFLCLQKTCNHIKNKKHTLQLTLYRSPHHMRCIRVLITKVLIYRRTHTLHICDMSDLHTAVCIPLWCV